MRKITDLKENECIEIRNEKEAKEISKLLAEADYYDYIEEAKERIGFPFLIKPLGRTKWGGTASIITLGASIIPASEFLPKRKSISKEVKELKADLNELRQIVAGKIKVTEAEVVQSGLGYEIKGDFKAGKEYHVNMKFNESANTFDKAIVKEYVSEELKELPEKWCVLRDLENHKIINEWANSKVEKGYSDSFEGYFFIDDFGSVDAYADLPEGYTEISFADFKRLVLKEGEKHESIDWDKPGQLLITNEGVLVVTSGRHLNTTFLASWIPNGKNYHNPGQRYWLKSEFKLYKEPITLCND